MLINSYQETPIDDFMPIKICGSIVYVIDTFSSKKYFKKTKIKFDTLCKCFNVKYICYSYNNTYEVLDFGKMNSIQLPLKDLHKILCQEKFHKSFEDKLK